MTATLRAVEELLATWNPIEVPEGLAISEYETYAPQLCHLARNGSDLVQGLIEVLGSMGVESTDLSPAHMQELEDLAASIETVVSGTHG